MMESRLGISIMGDNAHDFEITHGGETVARVWHSDQGEWTIDTVDGPSYTRRNRDDAIDLVADIVRSAS